MTTKTKKRIANPALRTIIFRRRPTISNYWYAQEREETITGIPASGVWDLSLCGDGVDAVLVIPARARNLHVTLYKRKPARGAIMGLTCDLSENRTYRERVLVIGDRRREITFSSEVDEFLIEKIFINHKISKCYVRVEWS
jgi:hypothetical protein